MGVATCVKFLKEKRNFSSLKRWIILNFTWHLRALQRFSVKFEGQSETCTIDSEDCQKDHPVIGAMAVDLLHSTRGDYGHKAVPPLLP